MKTKQKKGNIKIYFMEMYLFKHEKRDNSEHPRSEEIFVAVKKKNRAMLLGPWDYHFFFICIYLFFIYLNHLNSEHPRCDLLYSLSSTSPGGR